MTRTFTLHYRRSRAGGNLLCSHDAKMDDGMPFSGRVNGYNYHQCIDGNDYELTQSGAFCGMAFYNLD